MYVKGQANRASGPSSWGCKSKGRPRGFGLCTGRGELPSHEAGRLWLSGVRASPESSSGRDMCEGLSDVLVEVLAEQPDFRVGRLEVNSGPETQSGEAPGAPGTARTLTEAPTGASVSREGRRPES